MNREPGAIAAVGAAAASVAGFVLGGERPLRPDPVATALTLSVDAPGAAVAVGSDGRRDAPYNAARRLLAVDHLTGGRAGAVFRAGDGDAARTAERIRIIRELWSSWPRESLLADRSTGVYAETGGIRRIAHEGEHYRVAGALNSPSSLQGEPVSIWRVETAEEIALSDGLVDVVAVGAGALAAELVGAWEALDERTRPALAHADAGTIALRRAASTAELREAASGPAPSGADTLRERLGLPQRTLDLSDRPLAFGAAR